MDQLRWLSGNPDGGDLWEPEHDVIVIGSGYGGAIMANRLARTGKHVALLERGREIHPGSYPTTEHGALTQLQVTPSHFRFLNDRRNLYWLHVGDGMSVFSGCGLGGTSLVNANVSLKPECWVLEDEHWPSEIRTNPGILDPYYQRAAEILQPNEYPSSYPPLAKDAALGKASGGADPTHVPITVRFQSGRNAVGVEQHACTCCGDCVTGCNAWAKNTLLMNYLPDAVESGARIFTEIEVDYIQEAGASWIVFARNLAHDPRAKHDPKPIKTRNVVVAAGTMGSIGILLRSRDKGHLALSNRLGERFTGNGDLLGFTTRSDVPINGVGDGHNRWDRAQLAGPCITAAIDRTKGRHPKKAILIENAVIPGALARIVPPILTGESFRRWERRVRRRRLRGFFGLFRRDGRDGLRRTATYLVMGHDDDRGKVVIESDQAVVTWPTAGTSPYYRRANKVLRETAANLDGTYLRDPISVKELGHNLITVHPLGGCVMADDVADGVVDHAGRVFKPDPGGDERTYQGLYVCDGSVVPRPLGVNPLLTISALAERCAELMADEHGWRISPSPFRGDDPVEKPELPSQTPALQFTETLIGKWAPSPTAGSVPEDYTTCARLATALPIRYTINITASDVRKVIKDPATKMDVPSGEVTVDGLGSGRFTVTDGTFILLEPVKGTPDSHMIYRLPMADDGNPGARYFLSGYKIIRQGDVDDVWHDTTTLYVTVRANDDKGPVVGLGVMEVTVENVLRLVRSMRVTGPIGQVERMELLAKFGKMFAGKMFHDYGHTVHPSFGLKPNAPPRVRRPLELPQAKVYRFPTTDHVNLRLTRYNRPEIKPGPPDGDGRPVAAERGDRKAPVVLSHGMGANPLTFSLDTIKPNLVEYLVNRGYDVWLQEWRGSTLLKSSTKDTFTGDEVAALDHPATAEFIRTITQRDELHWITHCVGTMTVLMSTLGGYLKPASLLCSSAGAHPVANPVITFKTRLHLAEFLRTLGIKRLTTTSTTNESVWERFFDLAVRINWVPKDERCDQAVCHRLEFIYGVAAHHAAIDEVTHLALHELFGVTNLKMMSHLSECARQQSLVNANGENVYMPHMDRLRLPITFIHGAHNLVWLPQSSAVTYDELVDEFGSRNYKRVVLPQFGHQDLIMGASAPQDSFPLILEHLRKWGSTVPAHRALWHHPPAGARPIVLPPCVPGP